MQLAAIADAGSKFLITNISTNSKQKSPRLKLTLVLGVSAVPIYLKNIEKSVSLPYMSLKVCAGTYFTNVFKGKWQHLLISGIVSINLVLYTLNIKKMLYCCLNQKKFVFYGYKNLANPRRA